MAQQLAPQRAPQPPSTRRAGASTGGGGRGPVVSNAAAQDQLLSEGPGLGADAGPALDFGGASFDEGGAVPAQRGPEVTPGFDPRKKPDTIAVGDRGALIGTGSEVVVRSGKTARSRELFRVPDGAPAEVVTAEKSALRVRVRVGEKEQVGWVPRDVFTDQPGISRTDDSRKLPEDMPYAYFAGDHSPVDPKGTDTAQGALGDCFFIASMAAVANANPQAIKDAIRYNPQSGRYTVRFYEEDRGGSMKPVFIEVDAYLPTERGKPNDPAYAGDAGGPLWPAILEKAYAEFKGGYDVIGEGGTGAEAMAELTGVRSRSRDPGRMTEAEVVPYFQQAQRSGLAIYAGVRNTGKLEGEAPLRGAASGPYQGTLRQIHNWNAVEPGTVRVTDRGAKVGEARDTGQEGDETASLTGRDVKEGQVGFKSNQLSIRYRDGKAPATAEDLRVSYEYHGMLDPAKVLIGNHAYAFEGVVEGDKLQFYNPWGSYQPKPITAGEFLKFFDSLSTNAVPASKTGGRG